MYTHTYHEILLCATLYLHSRQSYSGACSKIARDRNEKTVKPETSRNKCVGFLSAFGACVVLLETRIIVHKCKVSNLQKHHQILSDHITPQFDARFALSGQQVFHHPVSVFSPPAPSRSIAGGASRRLGGGVSILEGQEVSNREAVAAKILARHPVQRHGPPQGVRRGAFAVSALVCFMCFEC